MILMTMIRPLVVAASKKKMERAAKVKVKIITKAKKVVNRKEAPKINNNKKEKEGNRPITSSMVMDMDTAITMPMVNL